MNRGIRVTGRLAAMAAILYAAVASAQIQGPSSSQTPYVLPTVPGVTTTSILTTGDSVGGYRMVGTPDGLGLFNNPGGNSLTLMMNHELGSTVGIARSHGQTGSFVSRWTIDRSNLSVTNGRDHNTSSADAFEWTGAGWSNAAGPAQQWNRYCSGDLAQTSAYQYTNPNTQVTYGTSERIFLNGEESGNEGRAYAHVATGPETNSTWRLPSLGRLSWENALASPYSQEKTVVMAMDDSTPGATAHGTIGMYIGTKQTTGNTIEKAGLTNGNFFSLKIGASQFNESRGSVIAPNTPFSFYDHGDVRNTTGATIDSDGIANGAANMLRPEDGAWDPRPGHENDYYFVTTDTLTSSGGRSRLYRMSFSDITNPQAGGTITNLLDGTEGGNMFDNITIDSLGRIILQEDIGNNSSIGKIWLYDINNPGGIRQIAQHDPSRFAVGGASFLTIDEESSGIIDAKDSLGLGWYLLDVQAHYGIPGELVEGGQLVAMYIDPTVTPEPAGFALFGLGALALIRRRR